MSQGSSFELLHDLVRKWIWTKGWSCLNEIQEKTIPLILKCKSDVIVSAPTAAGKTEAVFLPIISNLVSEHIYSGYRVLYISPLKALINDQHERLLDMTENTDIKVTAWHGDISHSIKLKSLKNPTGILLITPESLESLFVNKIEFLHGAFEYLKYIVIDELHSFIGTERGKQLQSLISRVEALCHRIIPRIAMSATFSDFKNVKQFLRNGDFPCDIPICNNSSQGLKILLKGCKPIGHDSSTDLYIARDIYNKLRGSNNLVFCNSRQEAEEYTVLLRELSAVENVPNEFMIHHGNVSAEERQQTESRLKMGTLPTTAICTSTLELGIDIGRVKSIVQIGTAASVSALRQRLGRSGRRGEDSILRVYSREPAEPLLGKMKAGLVQNIAVIELLLKKEYEVPNIRAYHFSTLIQQILSVLSTCGSFYAKEIWQLLCNNGAFSNVTSSMFLELLYSLGAAEIISQTESGQIVIGVEGERLLRQRNFYTAFMTADEYAVLNAATHRIIGYIAILPKCGQEILLAGRKWLVQNSSRRDRTIVVVEASYAGCCYFDVNTSSDIDYIIASKMKDIYASADRYLYLDSKLLTYEQLSEGRQFVEESGLTTNAFVRIGDIPYLFTWAGDKINRTIRLMAQYYLSHEVSNTHLYVSNLTIEDIEFICKQDIVDPLTLCDLIPSECKMTQKHDCYLSNHLLNLEYAAAHLDIDGAMNILNSLIKHHSPLKI